MSSRPRRPLLYVDVDGPLNPWAAKPHRRPAGYLTHRMLPNSWTTTERAFATSTGLPRRTPRPLRVWLNPDHGPALLALPVDLVWATTWEDEANEWIGPRIGLPELPAVIFPTPRLPGPAGTHWKTTALVEYAAGRPFCWLDDELSPADQDWLNQYHPAPALAHWVDPRCGLTATDLTAVTTWVANLFGLA